MKKSAQVVVSAVAFAVGLASCTMVTGRTVGRNIDDASITTSVKAKLAAERPGTLTSVDVDTVNGITYLTGTVPDSRASRQATAIAQEVEGVRQVVNNLQTRTAGDAPRQSY